MAAQARTELRREAPAARACERAHVLGHVHLGGVHLLDEARQLALGAAVPDHEGAAALAQGRVEVSEALEQELRARPGGVAAVEQAVVEAEERDDRFVGFERRPQRRVVVHAQVATEPDDRGHACWYG